MNRTVVTGASGFIGTRLVRRLSQTSRVVAIDRVPPRETLAGVEYLTFDVRRDVPLQAVEGASIIYNLAAVHRTPGHPPEEYYETNIGGALNIAKAAEAANVRTILFTSSISVYGARSDRFDEGTAVAPDSHYGRSKLMAETVHRDWSARSTGRRLIIVRPGVVFGPGEQGNYTRLIRSLRRGYFVYPGTRSTIKGGGYVEELLDTFDFAISSDQKDVCYNFAYPAESTTQEIVEAICTMLSIRRSPPVLPASYALLLASAATRVGLLNPSLFDPERVKKLLQSTRVSPGWLLEQGYQFKTDLRTGLESWRKEDPRLI